MVLPCEVLHDFLLDPPLVQHTLNCFVEGAVVPHIGGKTHALCHFAHRHSHHVIGPRTHTSLDGRIKIHGLLCV